MAGLVTKILACTLLVTMVTGRPTEHDAREKTLVKLLQCLIDGKSCQEETIAPQRENGTPGKRGYHGNKATGDVTIYYNGVIYTVDTASTSPWDENPQQAMVVQGEKIVYVGNDDGVWAYDE